MHPVYCRLPFAPSAPNRNLSFYTEWEEGSLPPCVPFGSMIPITPQNTLTRNHQLFVVVLDPHPFHTTCRKQHFSGPHYHLIPAPVARQRVIPRSTFSPPSAPIPSLPSYAVSFPVTKERQLRFPPAEIRPSPPPVAAFQAPPMPDPQRPRD